MLSEDGVEVANTLFPSKVTIIFSSRTPASSARAEKRFANGSS